MTEALLVTAIVLLIAVVVMLVFVLRRSTSTDLSPITAHLDTIEKSQERTERGVKEEIARNRVAVEGKLAQLQSDNTAKLEEMRRTISRQESKRWQHCAMRLGTSMRIY